MKKVIEITRDACTARQAHKSCYIVFIEPTENIAFCVHYNVHSKNTTLQKFSTNTETEKIYYNGNVSYVTNYGYKTENSSYLNKVNETVYNMINRCEKITDWSQLLELEQFKDFKAFDIFMSKCSYLHIPNIIYIELT